MAYLGAQPNKTLTKTTSQSFNGTGSATTFTLNRAVNTEEELEVFVENVQQEPGSGKSYTASGTTLTFDEAPPSGTGNIYVIYRGLAEVTTRLEHDANQALSATTGTFSGDLTVDTNTLHVDSTNNRVDVDTSRCWLWLQSICVGTGSGGTKQVCRYRRFWRNICDHHYWRRIHRIRSHSTWIPSFISTKPCILLTPDS